MAWVILLDNFFFAGGMFKRAGYSALGLSLTAAFCYPNETVDVVRTGVAHTSSLVQRKWDDFSGGTH